MNNLKTQLEVGNKEIRLCREFLVDRLTLFSACTDIDIWKKWFSPINTLEVQYFEPIYGGRIKYRIKDASMKFHQFTGVFHKVERPCFLTYTVECEGALSTVLANEEFIEVSPDKTLLKQRFLFSTDEEKDIELRSNFHKSLNDTHDRLESLFSDI